MPQHSTRTGSSIPTVLQNLVSVSLFFATLSIAQDAIAKVALQPSTAPLNVSMMQEGICAPGSSGISNTTISQTRLTEPSLWWIRDQIRAQEQYGNRLIDGWLACRSGGEPNRVDVMVNSQLWSLLDFFERYEFVNRFGTVTTGYGYNLRVFNGQGSLLAAYTCNFADTVAIKQDSANAQPVSCEVFDASARTNFWSPSRPLDGFSPTTGGTGQP